MPLTLYPITPDFAAEVGDVDLSRLDPETFEAIRDAFWRYAVLVFPDQNLTGDQQLAFADRIGPRDRGLDTGAPRRSRVTEGLIDVSNLMDEAKIWEADSIQRRRQDGNRIWHTDSSYNFVPGLASILYARSIAPVGGFTEFADERAAYDALSPAMKQRLDGLVAEHSWFTSRKLYGMENFSQRMRDLNPPSPHMLVRTLPQTGRKTLFLASYIGRVFGLSDAEAEALVSELFAHATQPQFVYRHRWRVGDVVMWDNRCTLHRGREYDDVRWARDFQRATTADVANTLEQEGVRVPEGYEVLRPA